MACNHSWTGIEQVRCKGCRMMLAEWVRGQRDTIPHLLSAVNELHEALEAMRVGKADAPPPEDDLGGRL